MPPPRWGRSPCEADTQNRGRQSRRLGSRLGRIGMVLDAQSRHRGRWRLRMVSLSWWHNDTRNKPMMIIVSKSSHVILIRVSLWLCHRRRGPPTSTTGQRSVDDCSNQNQHRIFPYDDSGVSPARPWAQCHDCDRLWVLLLDVCD